MDGESADERMKRVCLPVMNCVNADLNFTAETAEEFPSGRLPTLDFELWLKDGKIENNYFQKSMKIDYIVMERSAMGRQQKLSILSNELIRRLSKCDLKKRDPSERIKVIEQYVRELKKSEYKRVDVREIVLCGMK